jgi:hypothetical protein
MVTDTRWASAELRYESSANENHGEWRIIIDKSRSLGERLRGAGKITPDDPVVALLEEILGGQGDFLALRREASR